MHEVSCDEVATAITLEGGCSVFVGAGISVAAGIPTAEGIITQVAVNALACPNDCDVRHWLSKQAFFNPDAAYASILEAALPSENDRISYFDSLVSGKLPSQGHELLAKLVAQGTCRIVLTTNFDRLMEHAIVRICRHFPQVVSSHELPLVANVNTSRSRIYKLHGDYLYGNIRNLGHELAITVRSTASKLQAAADVGALLVVGYSGSDATVMCELMKIARTNRGFRGKVYWAMLEHVNPSATTMEFLSEVGGSIVRVKSSDQLFRHLVMHSPAGDTVFPSFGKAHRSPLGSETELHLAVAERLPGLEATEFLSLLKRHRTLHQFCDSLGALDAVLAMYEEKGDLGFNTATAIEQYIDFLTALELKVCSFVPTDAFARRMEQIVTVGLAERTQEGVQCANSALDTYVRALQMQKAPETPEEMRALLGDDGAYEALRMYVGLVPNSMHIVTAAINASVERPGLHGRGQPWPSQFYRAVGIAGAGNHVHHHVGQLLVNMLMLELDTKNPVSPDAVGALSLLGDAVVDYIIDYLLDTSQDMFSREDAALALGLIGTRKVVDQLAKRGASTTPYNRKFVIYALGLTENPRAVAAVRSLAPGVAESAQTVLNEAVRRLGCHDEPPRALAREQEEPPFLGGSKWAFFAEHCPGLGDRGAAQPLLELYEAHGPAVFKKAMSSIGWPPDLTILAQASKNLRISGRLAEAEIIIGETLDRYPMIDHIYHDMGIVLGQQNRLTAARRYFSVALVFFDPNYADFYNDFAVTMIALGDLEAARYLLVFAICMDRASYLSWFNLGSVWLGMGKLYGARICFRRTLSLYPEHTRARKALEGVCTDLGADPEWIPSEREVRSALHLDEGEPGGAFVDESWSRHSRQALDEFGRSTDCRYRGDMDEALSAIDEALRHAPNSAEILGTKAKILDAMGRLAESSQAFEAMLAIHPWDRRMLMSYSICLSKSGRHLDAIRRAQEAVRCDPDAPGAWVSLAGACLAAGKRDSARDALVRAKQMSPPYSWLMLRAASMLNELEVPGSFFLG